MVVKKQLGSSFLGGATVSEPALRHLELFLYVLSCNLHTENLALREISAACILGKSELEWRCSNNKLFLLSFPKVAPVACETPAPS